MKKSELIIQFDSDDARSDFLHWLDGSGFLSLDEYLCDRNLSPIEIETESEELIIAKG